METTEKKIRIAIYSGTIPSTTFIENLIQVMGECDCEILVFGKKKKVVNYKRLNIREVFFPYSILGKLLFILRYSFFISLRSPVTLRLIFTILGRKYKVGRNFFFRISELLPVVYYKPHIFHVQWVKSLESWVILKEMIPVKLIVSLRGIQVNISPVVDVAIANGYRKSFPLVDGFHAVSEKIALEASKYGAEGNKIAVIYSALNQRIFSYVKNESIPKSNKVVHIISVGRFRWVKGYKYALDAMNLIKGKGVLFKYTIIGRDVPDETLYQIDDLGLNDNVFIVKELPQSRVFEQIRDSDLFLLPSVEEGIANVVLEAMAIGVPVVSSDCGGMQEVIDHGHNGFLFNNRDTEDMCNQILECLSLTENERDLLINSARRTIIENHNRDLFKNQMWSFYNRILA